jgi:Trypsin-like peptidase domain
MTVYYEFSPNNSLPFSIDVFFNENASFGSFSIRFGGFTDSLSNVGVLNELAYQSLSVREKLEIIIKRLVQKQNPSVNAKPIMTSVFGQPDFLPFPFLSLGVKRGASVCRILRKFATEDNADKFVSAIQNVANIRGESLSLEILAEILCISMETAVKLFQQSSCSQSININGGSFIENEEIRFTPVASGFLVGRDKLLTNHHIFFNSDTIKNKLENLDISEYFAEFNYEQDLLGRNLEPIKYRFKEVLIADQELDFALVQLDSQPYENRYSTLGNAGDNFGWIPLVENKALIAPPWPGEATEDDLNIIKSDLDLKYLKGDVSRNLLGYLQSKSISGDPVNIIQHPKGRYKEVVLSNNRLIDISKNFILYEADTDFSSSGSPVMNQQWQLVGLHRGVLYKAKETTIALSQSEGKTSDNLQGSIEVSSEVGVRTSQIIKKIVECVNARVSDLNSSDDRIKIMDLWFFVKNFVQLDSSQIRSFPGFEGYEENPTQQSLTSY